MVCLPDLTRAGEKHFPSVQGTSPCTLPLRNSQHNNTATIPQGFFLLLEERALQPVLVPPVTFCGAARATWLRDSPAAAFNPRLLFYPARGHVEAPTEHTMA